MKRLILHIVSLFVLLVLFYTYQPPVHASYKDAYADYTYQSNLYREAYSQFTVARSAYLTYQTLASQNTAINSFRTVIKARNAVISSYYDLLQEKLNITPSVADLDIKAFSDIRKNTKDWLKLNNDRIEGSATIEDLNSVSDEFAQRYPTILIESKQSIGRILYAKGTYLDIKLGNAINDVKSMLATLSTDNDVTVMERGIIQAQVKRDLFTQKHDAVRSYFFPKDSYNLQNISLLSGQQAAISANQYLSESSNYLMEIIKSITE